MNNSVVPEETGWLTEVQRSSDDLKKRDGSAEFMVLRESSTTCEAVEYSRERSTRLIWLTSLHVGNAASNAAFNLDTKPCLMN